MSREAVHLILAGQARDDAWYQALFAESLMSLVQDKDPKACTEQLRPLIEAGPDALRAHGRLLMAHAYRAMGRRRLALFNYQAVARRDRVDEATILALAALVEIGDDSSKNLAKSRIELLRQQDPPIPHLDLLEGGDSLLAIQELLGE